MRSRTKCPAKYPARKEAVLTINTFVCSSLCWSTFTTLVIFYVVIKSIRKKTGKVNKSEYEIAIAITKIEYDASWS